MVSDLVIPLLKKALESRASLFDARHETAFRLFNGFTEGEPKLVVDLYASTLVIHNYADDPAQGQPLVEGATKFLQEQLVWLRAGLVKTRNGKTPEEKRGQLLFGDKPDTKIKEHGVWYSVNLTMNRDASLYLDTRFLRRWLIEHMQGKTVLNTFAYTGSLGVAALAGGATRVVQHDINLKSLVVARESYALNSFPVQETDFIPANFFSLVGQFKSTNELFDCVIVDPPFFSATSKGKVDQVNESARLINKVRPLIRDGGTLIAINNALYVSGRKYMKTLEELAEDGYLTVSKLISVPMDFTGYPRTRQGKPITDPAPFNHSTKIAVLEVKRK